MSEERAAGDDDRAISATVPARAALAGNPSDGHGGAVVAIPVPDLAATVHLTPSRQFEIGGGGAAFDSLDELVTHVDAHGFGDEARSLVLASIRSVVRLTAIRPGPCRLDVETTIPRSVGLAGSSAIVIATTEALARSASTDTPRPLTPLDSPNVVAVLAHAAEVDELGIAAGLQDRLVQAHRTPVLMDFDPALPDRALGRRCGRTRPLGTIPGDLVVGWRSTSSASSGIVHGGLRSRGEDEDVVRTMAALGDVARDAADAIERHDLEALGRSMDRTFDLRRSVMDLDPDHVEMVDAVRSAGGHANYTGSGGAVVALGPSGSAPRWIEVLTALPGVEAVAVSPRN